MITGNVMVDRTQLGEPGNVVIEDDRDLDALTRWAKATQDGGVPDLDAAQSPGPPGESARRSATAGRAERRRR